MFEHMQRMSHSLSDTCVRGGGPALRASPCDLTIVQQALSAPSSLPGACVIIQPPLAFVTLAILNVYIAILCRQRAAAVRCHGAHGAHFLPELASAEGDATAVLQETTPTRPYLKGVRR